MLYISSRSKTDSFTAHRALHFDTAPDQGVFVPFHLPVLDREQILELRDQSFSQIVAKILNLFFSCGISQWDVECSAGRYPVRLQEMSHRLIAAELWHNPEGCYEHIEKNIAALLAGDTAQPTQWVRIAIRIAILFATYSTLPEDKSEQIDIAVACGDFVQPMAAWYARKMGLPIGTIICACNDNSDPWDLICRGELNMASATVSTQTPDFDHPCPQGLERLVFETLGHTVASEFADARCRKTVFRLTEEQLPLLQSGLTAAVVGDGRIETIVRSVFRTSRYLIDPYAAIPFGAIQDYRARSGESRVTLFFTDHSPLLDAKKIAKIVDLQEEELKSAVNFVKE